MLVTLLWGSRGHRGRRLHGRGHAASRQVLTDHTNDLARMG
ncbi:hypothetical protein ACRAWD_16440 [Caulobacter segnis]